MTGLLDCFVALRAPRNDGSPGTRPLPSRRAAFLDRRFAPNRGISKRLQAKTMSAPVVLSPPGRFARLFRLDILRHRVFFAAPHPRGRGEFIKQMQEAVLAPKFSVVHRRPPPRLYFR
jgi:hypothetical protein